MIIETKTELDVGLNTGDDICICPSDKNVIELTPTTDKLIDIYIADESKELDVDFESNASNIESYPGPYVITPKRYDEQVLDTKEKYMNDNITVLKVPYSEVSNAAGGTTCNIAFVM